MQTLRLTHEPGLTLPRVFLRTVAGVTAGDAGGYALTEDSPGRYSVATIADGVALEGLDAELQTNGVSIGTDTVREIAAGDFRVGEPITKEFAATAVAQVDSEALSADLATNISLLAVRQLFATGPLASDRIVTRGTTWRISFPDALPAGWTRIEFTARAQESDDQADSLLHVRLSNPPDATTDGLKVLAGQPAGSAAGAQIQTANVATPLLVVTAETTAGIEPTAYRWDAKVWTANGLDPAGRGELIVEADVTRST